jgi:acetolactate synthase-1/2/3 large subunit
VVDLEALYSPITKATLALKPRGALEKTRAAIALALAGRPGPVHIRLNNEDATKNALPEENSTEPPSENAKDSLPQIDRAYELLRRSKRPLILAGLGLEPERPYRELRRLAEAIQSPLIVTPKAKGAIPDDHPLSAGVIGLTRSDPVYEVLDDADFLLAVGLDVVELVRPWEHPAPLVWLAPWNNRDPTLPAEAEMVGPMKPFLTQLAEVSPSGSQNWGAPRLAEHRRRHPVLSPAHVGFDPMRPQAVLRVLRENLPPETLLTTDVGSHKILTSLEWPAYVPNRFLLSNGLSSMGYGLPAAIAAGLLDSGSGSTIVCTTGDAGLTMTLGELNTLSRLSPPVIVVVFKDHALDLIRSHQKRAGKPSFGTEFRAPDFVRVAEAHGIQACHVSKEEHLAEALRRYLESAQPALIEVEIDPSTYPTTPR